MPNEITFSCPKCGGSVYWSPAYTKVIAPLGMVCESLKCGWHTDTFSVVSGQVSLGDRFAAGVEAIRKEFHALLRERYGYNEEERDIADAHIDCAGTPNVLQLFEDAVASAALREEGETK